MSSTNKTSNLKLNSWIGSDKPQREDFNRDNSIIDNIVSTHHSNSEIHTTADEKSKWNAPYYMNSYFGNGSVTRNITLGCDFTPGWGIIFAINYLPGATDFKNSAHYNYFAIVSQNGSTVGAELSGKKLTVTQSSVAVFGNEFRSFNETGTTYYYVMFR